MLLKKVTPQFSHLVPDDLRITIRGPRLERRVWPCTSHISRPTRVGALERTKRPHRGAHLKSDPRADLELRLELLDDARQANGRRQPQHNPNCRVRRSRETLEFYVALVYQARTTRWRHGHQPDPDLDA